MKKITKILLFTVLFALQMNVTFADRGVGKNKNNNKVVINIKTTNNFKSNLNFNLRNGMSYTGSLNTKNMVSTNTYSNTFITYQKGSSVYILPYKQKILVADVRQGYTGTKLIIKVN
ncbi:hypothetical protein ACFOWM_04990 [Ferruginibacter yonginensis]|uniref:Uncharacterized protein n=1 Tax=Ferruginibacter yonginensis TaxID=1310416 RepID=A0ABV8QT41_9BACT